MIANMVVEITHHNHLLLLWTDVGRCRIQLSPLCSDLFTLSNHLLHCCYHSAKDCTQGPVQGRTEAQSHLGTIFEEEQ